METLNLGIVQVGNNHTTSHLIDALRSNNDPDSPMNYAELFRVVGELNVGMDVQIVYSDRFGNPYAEVFDSEEFYEMLRDGN